MKIIAVCFLNYMLKIFTILFHLNKCICNLKQTGALIGHTLSAHYLNDAKSGTLLYFTCQASSGLAS